MKVLYFAWLRERIGESEEIVDASGLATVSDLVTALRAKGERHEAAFAEPAAVRVAVNRKVRDFDAPLDGATEVAFFPPMTGG
ncbi:molybdopterin converting factor subunit 1 [Pikeienuella piscinae]|uniref:Molybdopterin converting factor subunit 1 n=1 Tax=Pikeienuella piscinae TaxID=2748098 RepID=A0A7M3T574_9RHOB|nr:molybdopterin converting factor subunit 1 [Pikeienuella piscinae]QIE57155.1 molybdopterin converting factor subunit 1 [Pikeienuella piscinae]